LKRHPSLAGDFINFVSRFSSIMNQPIDRVYKDEFKKLYAEPHEYITVINDIFPYLHRHSAKEVRESGILDYWVDLSLEQAGIDAQKSPDEKIAALTLLTEIWLAYTDYLDKKEDRLSFVQGVLKKAARDRQRSLRIVAVSLMFRLLDKFAEEKNSSAPALYKSLIFSLIENPSDILMREHYFGNFTALFET
jgi:DNA-binding ferritin-like protein (Dps family)